MEVQQARVRALEQQASSLDDTLQALKALLKREQNTLQKMCAEHGHEFEAEDNGDCHSPGYYYTCKHCRYWTNIKPRSMISRDALGAQQPRGSQPT